MSQLSKNLRYLRHFSDCTQEEFAQILGIKRSSLGAYEEGRANPNLSLLLQISKMFGVTIEQLMSVDVSTLPLKPVAISEKVFANTETDEPLSEEILEVLHKEKIYVEKEEAKKSSHLPKKETPADLENKPIPPQETFEKIYPTLDDDLFSEETPLPDDSVEQGDIPLVKQNNLLNYLAECSNISFIKKLPKIQISLLPKNREYRAFEMDKHFPLQKSIVVGAYVKNWYGIQTGKFYLLLTQKQGLVYGKVENRLRNEGYIGMQSPLQYYKINLRELLEVWEFQLLISAGRIENLL